jgi:hypothetical protein
VSSQGPDPGFTVVDRRRRGDDEPPPSPAEAPPATPAQPEPRPRAEARPAAAARPEPAAPPHGGPRADFASLCVMLYSEALVHLGQVPDPVTGQPHSDLEQAQFTIDLLAMLERKTEGNRTPEETAVLGEALATLRMAYVRASRRA